MSSPSRAAIPLRVLVSIEVAALVCGTSYSLSRKYMNLLRAEGLPGLTTYFRHPLYQGMWCFAGQLLAWPLWRLEQRGALGSHEDAAATLDGKAEPPVSGRRAAALCAVPTLFDVLGTVLNNAGLILTDVSVYQMLRGSVILFTALASRALFRRPFTEVDLQGLGLVGVGILCIGLANTIFWDYSAHHGHMAMRRGEYAPWPAMGNFLIILSQALMAGLFIAEELLLKERHLPPLRLVAWEGSLGVAFNAALLLLTLLLPGPDAGALENPVHATLQLFHSPLIFLAVSVMALSLLAFNLAGVYITKFQTATHRACVDATRQVLVWAHALAVGWEAFNRTELLGYALLLLGTLQYSGVVELPLIHAWLRRKGYAPI